MINSFPASRIYKISVLVVVLSGVLLSAQIPVFAAQTITGTTINATTLNATTIAGTYTGTLGAANVSAGIFGSNTGGGTFIFPLNAGVQSNAYSNTGYYAMNNNSTYWGIMGNYGVNDWRLGYGSPTALTGWNLRWDNAGNVWANASFSSGGIINATNYLQVNGKYAIDGTDTYLRLNQQNSFTSGIYTPYVFRATGIIYTDSSFRYIGDANTIMDSNQFYCNNASNCHFNWSGSGGTYVGNAAGTTISTQLTTGNLYLGGPIYRSVANAGYLNGQYAGVETAGGTPGAIYTIGGAYVPTASSLNNMYGIGYGYTGGTAALQGTTGAPASNWGMYVASAGTPRIFLSSDTGNIYAAGQVRAAGNIYANGQGTYGLYLNSGVFDTVNTGSAGDPLELNYYTAGDVRIVGGDVTMADNRYLYPGSITAGYGYQKSWYLASSPSWGLYTNTSLYAAGGLYTAGGYGILGPSTSYGSLRLVTPLGGYYGILMGNAGTASPNFMWDGSGNGGIYYQNWGWSMYYLVSSRHWSFNTSTDYGYTLGVNGNIYGSTGVYDAGNRVCSSSSCNVSNMYPTNVYATNVYTNAWPVYSHLNPPEGEATKFVSTGTTLVTGIPSKLMCSTTASNGNGSGNEFLMELKQVASGIAYYFFAGYNIQYVAATGAFNTWNLAVYCYLPNGTWGYGANYNVTSFQDFR